MFSSADCDVLLNGSFFDTGLVRAWVLCCVGMEARQYGHPFSVMRAFILCVLVSDRMPVR